MKSEWKWIETVKGLCKGNSLSRPYMKGLIKQSIGDDAAVLRWTSEKDLLVTSDMILERKHFLLKAATPQQIGHKAMAVNLSDIAAMGGIPKNAVVSLGVPAKIEISFLKKMYAGMIGVAKRFGVTIVGGDTNASEGLIISVTLLGEVERGRAVLRSGAKAHDWLFVSGELGGSYRSQKHLNFTPRVKEARELVQNFHVHSMMDLSDGLGSDVRRIMEESHVGAILEEKLIPKSKYAGTIENALSDGEDFELLFSLSPEEGKKIISSKKYSSRFTKIGEIVAPGKGLSILGLDGRLKTLKIKGFDHFKK